MAQGVKECWYVCYQCNTIKEWDAFSGPSKRRLKRRLRAKCLECDYGACEYCGTFTRLTKDHIWPKSKGGTSDPSNLAKVCVPCNSRKGDMEPIIYFQLYGWPVLWDNKKKIFFSAYFVFCY